MENKITYDTTKSDSPVQQLASDAVIEVLAMNSSLFTTFFVVCLSYNLLLLIVCCMQVSIEIPFPFQVIPKQAIESTGTQVLEQILRIMLPRFMAQVCLFKLIHFYSIRLQLYILVVSRFLLL